MYDKLIWEDRKLTFFNGPFVVPAHLKYNFSDFMIPLYCLGRYHDNDQDKADLKKECKSIYGESLLGCNIDVTCPFQGYYAYERLMRLT